MGGGQSEHDSAPSKNTSRSKERMKERAVAHEKRRCVVM
jgi:hypothetical protein